MKQRVLFVYGEPYYYGGGAGLAAHALEALCRTYEVTCLTPGQPDFGRIDAFFGTQLSEVDIQVRSIPDLGFWGWMYGVIPGRWIKLSVVQRLVRRLGQMEQFDVFASVIDEFAYPIPGVQYVHYPRLERYHDLSGYGRLARMLGIPRAYQWLSARIGGELPEAFARNLTLVNSRYTGNAVQAIMDTTIRVLNPPVFTTESPLSWEERDSRFLSVGRLSGEKQFPLLISILKRVRDLGHDITFTIAGTWDCSDDFRELVMSLIRENADWIELAEGLPQPELASLMDRCRYGLHGMVGEHFGMAPAEMQNTGSIVFAHKSGGPMEILGHDERLLWENEEDAVQKIHRVLSDDELRCDVLRGVSNRMGEYSLERFKTGFMDAVHEMANHRIVHSTVHPDVRLTIAIPLYRSAAFLDRIVANVEAFDREGVEIIISDHHLADDTLDVLRDRLGGRDRVTFRGYSDNMGWVSHYNELLETAQGAYVCVVSHDDEYDADAVMRMCDILDAKPEAIVVHGRATDCQQDGQMFGPYGRNSEETHPSGIERALSLFGDFNGRWIPFHGVFRRSVLIDNRVRLPFVRDHVFADVCFVMECLLYGTAIQVDDPFLWKHKHGTNTSSAWTDFRLRHHRSIKQHLRMILERASTDVAQRKSASRRLRWLLFRNYLRVNPVAQRVLGPLFRVRNRLFTR